MLRQCAFCHRAFSGNDTLESFPVSRRIAYDPARGRLWAVCPACRRWSLAPIEERWEALEALERLRRERGQVQASTANVSLLRAGGLELVRVGEKVGVREESHWRYARGYAARLRRAELLENVGEALDTTARLLVAVTGFLLVGAGLDLKPDPDKWLRWARLRRFGRRAWTGDASCGLCGQPLAPVEFEQRGALVLEPAPGRVHRLRRLCPGCGRQPGSGMLLDTPAAEHVVRRSLAYENYAGARPDTIGDAVALLEHVGSTERFLEKLALGPLVLGRIPLRRSIALEIALAERAERELAALEAAALEARWREEEALAAIVDGELTPPPPPYAPRGSAPLPG
ncbi:MAG TPA: hypothetical protein VF832_14330 [Longimicrobiales bacterium]